MNDIQDHTQTGPGNNSISCRRCGQIITLALPLPLNVAVSVLRAFADLHQWCGLYAVFVQPKGDKPAS